MNFISPQDVAFCTEKVQIWHGPYCFNKRIGAEEIIFVKGINELKPCGMTCTIAKWKIFLFWNVDTSSQQYD